jgi:hypothetical protein
MHMAAIEVHAVAFGKDSATPLSTITAGRFFSRLGCRMKGRVTLVTTDVWPVPGFTMSRSLVPSTTRHPIAAPTALAAVA